jgi:hypothetical protein
MQGCPRWPGGSFRQKIRGIERLHTTRMANGLHGQRSKRGSLLQPASLGNSFNIGLGVVAGACQHRHALSGHLPSHLAQFVRTLVVNGCELF